MQVCEWLGIAGMIAAFSLGFLLAYLRGLNKQIELIEAMLMLNKLRAEQYVGQRAQQGWVVPP